MTFLLDTQVVLWISVAPERLSQRVQSIAQDRDHQVYFSPVSWIEIAIKRMRKGKHVLPSPDVLRIEWLVNGFMELPLTGEHATFLDKLPPLHKDPFDRILLAQAGAANLTSVTADDILVRYPGDVLDAR